MVLEKRRIREENIENRESKLLNWKSIAIGSIITFIGFIISLEGFFIPLKENSESLILFLGLYALIPLIGGFSTAFINKSNYRVGIINGALATLIGLIIFQLYDYLSWIIIDKVPYNIFYVIEDKIWLIIPVVLLGIFGAVIGTSIKKLRIYNRQIKA